MTKTVKAKTEPVEPEPLVCKVLRRETRGVKPGGTFTPDSPADARQLARAGLVEVRQGRRRLHDGDLVAIIEGIV